MARNRDYRTEVSLWQATVRDSPAEARANCRSLPWLNSTSPTGLARQESFPLDKMPRSENTTRRGHPAHPEGTRPGIQDVGTGTGRLLGGAEDRVCGGGLERCATSGRKAGSLPSSCLSISMPSRASSSESPSEPDGALPAWKSVGSARAWAWTGFCGCWTASNSAPASTFPRGRSSATLRNACASGMPVTRSRPTATFTRR